MLRCRFRIGLLFLLSASMLIFQSFSTDKKAPAKAKNVILLIGDGMGHAQLFGASVLNKQSLVIESFPVTGMSKTSSADDYVTDSAAGGTALSAGQKTNNGYLAVDPQKQPLQTILEIAEKNSCATGLVSTSSVTHATPASFIAHVADRNSYEDIALWFLKTDIDVFIGGGYDHFAKRADGADLTQQLTKKGYTLATNMDDVAKHKTGKLAALVAPVHCAKMSEGRGDMLPKATRKALELLSVNKKGFFLMVEGSQIDWGNHANDRDYVFSEMLDFDQAVREALEFARKDGNTLVIVTADHESGGLTLPSGNLAKGEVGTAFSTKGHSGVPVPVFAYGPGAENFTGVFENTAIFTKILKNSTIQSKK